MFIKYLFIGGWAYCIDFGIYLSLIFIYPSINLIYASSLGKLISSIFSLLAHRFFTFNHSGSKPKILQQTWRYFFLVALNIPFCALVLAITLNLINNPFLAKITADVLCVYISYLLSKHFIFHRHSKQLP